MSGASLAQRPAHPLLSPLSYFLTLSILTRSHLACDHLSPTLCRSPHHSDAPFPAIPSARLFETDDERRAQSDAEAAVAAARAEAKAAAIRAVEAEVAEEERVRAMVTKAAEAAGLICVQWRRAESMGGEAGAAAADWQTDVLIFELAEEKEASQAYKAKAPKAGKVDKK